MRITRLGLTNVRRYREAELELHPGLTIVRGPNEAGKSTIQRAIELALTRRVTSTAGDLDGLLPWDGGPDDRSAIKLDFTYEDEGGATHAGRLEKHFRGPKGTVRLVVDGEVITDPAAADETLAALSGVPTEAFFQVPAGGLWQIFVFCGVIEHFSNGFKMSGETMFKDGRKPGALGFDPLGFGKNPQTMQRYALAEIKNGRLAMMGVGGMVHGYLLTGKGPVELLTNFQGL